jgi:hypothetical protein
MKLLEDCSKYGLKYVAVVKQGQFIQLDWFICIVVLTVRIHKTTTQAGCKQ